MRWSSEAGTSGVMSPIVPQLPAWPRAPRARGDVILQRASLNVWGQPRAYERSPCRVAASGDHRHTDIVYTSYLSRG